MAGWSRIPSGKLELVEESVSPSKGEITGAEIQHSVNVMEDKGGQGSALGETGIYIEEKQDTKESGNTPEEGAYNTNIKKDGLTIYTNYSVDIVGDLLRVGGVNDLVSHFDESENAGGEVGEQGVAFHCEG